MYSHVKPTIGDKDMNKQAYERLVGMVLYKQAQDQAPMTPNAPRQYVKIDPQKAEKAVENATNDVRKKVEDITGGTVTLGAKTEEAITNARNWFANKSKDGSGTAEKKINETIGKGVDMFNRWKNNRGKRR